MRFFLVARDRVDGSLTMLNHRGFHAREDAMDALRADPPVLPPFTDVFAVDLEGAAPVLLLGSGPGHPVEQRPAEDAAVVETETPIEDDDPVTGGPMPRVDVRFNCVSAALSDLTCDDCIYRSACRDAHTSAPAACRSFQRRVG